MTVVVTGNTRSGNGQERGVEARKDRVTERKRNWEATEATLLEGSFTCPGNNHIWSSNVGESHMIQEPKSRRNEGNVISPGYEVKMGENG